MTESRLLRYKYVSDPQYIEAGSIRLAGPQYYGTIEGQRADQDECTTRSHLGGRTFYVADGRGSHFETSPGVHVVNCGKVVVGGVGAIARRLSSPPLIYCLCNRSDNTYGDPKGETAIFEVDVRALVIALQRARPEMIGKHSARSVTYTTHEGRAGQVPPPPNPFHKSKKFKDEDEFRVIFDWTRPEDQSWGATNFAQPVDVQLGPRPDIFRRIR